MKRIIIIVLIFSAGFSAKSQLKGFSVGPYVEMAWPTGDFNITHRNGIGAGISGDVRLGRIGLTGSAGVLRFGGKTVSSAEGTTDHETLTALPVRIGLKFRPVPLFYVKLEGGSANYTNNNGNAFILSPGVGLRLLGLDVQFKYETWMADQTKSMWGVRAGYNF